MDGVSDEDEARIVEILRSLGVDDAELPTDGWEAVQMASDVVMARGERHSAHGLSHEIGVSVDEVIHDLGLLGIEIDDVTHVAFTDDDLELTRFLHEAMGELMSDDEGIDILRVVATSLEAMAEAAVVGHVQGPERRLVGDGVADGDDGPLDAVAHVQLNAAIAEAGLVLGHHLGTVFRHHLRQASDRNRLSQNYEDRDLARLAVGFVDLVGFTALSQELDTKQLIAVIRSFEHRAHDLARRHRTRVAKLIGDEAMLVAVDPTDAAAFMRALIDTFEDDAVVPRGGLVTGDVINVHGDYFGPVVNLAARLVDAAVPGEVLVDDAVAAVDAIATEPAGRRMLKGFEDPVRVHTLR